MTTYQIVSGMDTLVEVIDKQGSSGKKNTEKPTDPLEVLDMLQEYIMKVSHQKPTQFSHLHRRVRSTLEQLMATANLRKAAFPQASLAFGTMGKSVVFFVKIMLCVCRISFFCFFFSNLCTCFTNLWRILWCFKL